MRKTFVVTTIVLLTALTVPALAAWNIPNDAASAAVVTPNPPKSWAAVLQKAVPAASAEARAHAVSSVVRDQNSSLAQSYVVTNRAAFMKSAEDMKVLRPIITGPNAAFPTSTAVPEPGSIAGLSAGLLGLIFQVRRSRRGSQSTNRAPLVFEA